VITGRHRPSYTGLYPRDLPALLLRPEAISSGRVFESNTISGISDPIRNENYDTDVTGKVRCVAIFVARIVFESNTRRDEIWGGPASGVGRARLRTATEVSGYGGIGSIFRFLKCPGGRARLGAAGTGPPRDSKEPPQNEPQNSGRARLRS